MLEQGNDVTGRSPSVQEQSTPGDSTTDNDEVLQRQIDMTSISFSLIAWLIVFIIALGIRFIGRTEWPLSPDESAIARDAWALLNGYDLSGTADSHPLLVQLTSFLMFLFGDTDYVARTLPLIGSFGILAVLFWLRQWFGELPALSIAVLWAISPIMTMSALRLDGGSLLVLASFLTLTLTITLSSKPDLLKSIVLGVAIAAGLTVHPLGWLVIPMTLIIGMGLMRDFSFGGQILTVISSFSVTFLVITTWFGTRLTAPLDVFSASSSALANDHLAGPGSHWSLPLTVLLVDGPMLVPLTLAGVALAIVVPDLAPRTHPAILLSVAIWAAPVLVFGILTAGDNPAQFAVTLFPLIVSAGLGLAILLELAYRYSSAAGRPVLWAIVVLGLLIAVYRFAEHLVLGPEGDLTSWLLSSAALIFLILLPLAYVTIRLTAGTSWHLLPVAGLLIVAVFGLSDMRTSLLLHDAGQERPGELLIAGSSTPAVSQIAQRITTYSRDVTSSMREVRDPTGGHGLMIVVQQELADPFAWYFRDFPNLTIIEEPDRVPGGIEPDFVIATASNSNGWAEHFEEHIPRMYSHMHVMEASQERAARLLLTAINPLEYANLFDFIVFRENPALIERAEMILLVRADHAETLWGISGNE
jgi:hypothetical protein